jgi:hypothetical protein
MSIETLVDLEMITVDELIGRVKPKEERINCNNSKSIASLNLMKDELVVRLSSRLKTSSNGGGDRQKESSSGGGRRGRGHGKVRGTRSGGHGGSRGSGDARNHGRGNADRGSGGGSSDVTKDECHYCSKKGHWAHECKKKKRDEEVHTAQVEEEDESTLFMASTTVIEPISVQAHLATVHFEENKLFV